jgi:hypothetical protein
VVVEKQPDADFASRSAAGWWVVDGDVKERARLNVVTHLLGTFPTRTSRRMRRRNCAAAAGGCVGDRQVLESSHGQRHWNHCRA